jgi:sugar phosphate isomerase/epimerase
MQVSGEITLTDISLSTMWSMNYQNMTEFIRDAREFGFTHLELNTSLTPGKLNELRAIEGVEVSSVHAPCPNTLTSDGSRASSLSLSSLNEDERQEAVNFTKSTIDLASELKARVVILHAGWVDANPEMEKELRNLHERGLAESDEFQDLKCKLTNIRGFMACPHIDAVKESLLELAGYARARKVQLALENRVNSYEIPNIDEMLDILEEFQPEVVGYWHDVGHAEIQARLGFTPHDEWLMALEERLIGTHLHDVRGIRDHFAPGLGEQNWDLIAESLPKNALRVCEIGEWNDSEDAHKAVAFLQSKGIV